MHYLTRPVLVLFIKERWLAERGDAFTEKRRRKVEELPKETPPAFMSSSYLGYKGAPHKQCSAPVVRHCRVVPATDKYTFLTDSQLTGCWAQEEIL